MAPETGVWARALHWWRDPEHRRDEKSNSFAMMVVMLPLIIGAFGTGVDLAKNVYVRTSIQNNLDLATSSAAAAAIENGRHVDAAKARLVVAQVYAVNRKNGPGLTCTGSGRVVPGTTAPRCWTASRAPVVTARSVSYTIHEKSRNSFLHVLGIPTQSYTIRSVAILNQTTQ